jgi:ribulose-phosphate 3-epimerase
MNHVVPAVIPQSFDHLTDAVQSVRSFAEEVQIDIVDGHFVPFTSWPYRGSGSVMLLREIAGNVIVEVDLMIERPESALPLYVDAGVKKVVIHLESTTEMNAILAHHRSHDYELGLSIGNDTPLGKLRSLISEVDYVQLMGIRHIGSQGQPFDDEVLTRVSALRTEFPELTISIDGSVNTTTLPLLKAAGANRFVSGSAIFDAADLQVAYESLANL